MDVLVGDHIRIIGSAPDLVPLPMGATGVVESIDEWGMLDVYLFYEPATIVVGNSSFTLRRVSVERGEFEILDRII